MTAFSVTWDYRCPFARNVHETLLDGLEAGADWQVRFAPFSLGQAHVEEGQPSVWDEPERDSGLLSLQAGVVVRDRFPDHFHGVHRALFAARHDEGRKLKEEATVRDALQAGGADPDAVLAEVASGAPLDAIRSEHEAAVTDHSVWGVPTFVVGDKAVFVRLMERPRGDGKAARRWVDRVLDLLGDFPELNEFKHTSVPR